MYKPDLSRLQSNAILLGRGRNTHGTIVFLVAVMFVVAMVTINLICNYKTSGRLYDRDLALHGLPSPERVVRV